MKLCFSGKNELSSIFKISLPVLWFMRFSCIRLISQNYSSECVSFWVWWHWTLRVLWGHVLLWLMEDFVLSVPHGTVPVYAKKVWKHVDMEFQFKRPASFREYFWQLQKSTYLNKILKYLVFTCNSLKWCLCMSLKENITPTNFTLAA